MDIKEIENLDLDKLLENDKVIILEFYTSWCPTCKMVAMTLEEYERMIICFSKKYIKKLSVLRTNNWQNKSKW